VAKGFVAGFIRREGKWVGQWISINEPAKRRRLAYDDACADLAKQLAIYCGGEAPARRNLIFVDGLGRDGREFLERIFDLLRDEPTPESP
jgi:hypothetical protein